MEYTIREMTVMEYPLLNEFLYEAIFIPDGIKPPPKNIIASPELQIYVDRFGASKADFALVAEVEQKIVGAVWVRIIHDYGHIDDETPSLGQVKACFPKLKKIAAINAPAAECLMLTFLFGTTI